MNILFLIRIVNLWNNLRKETAEAKDLRSFKNNLFSEFSQLKKFYIFYIYSRFVFLYVFVLYK